MICMNKKIYTISIGGQVILYIKKYILMFLRLKKTKLSVVYSTCVFKSMTASKLSTKNKYLHRKKNYFNERLVLLILCTHY